MPALGSTLLSSPDDLPHRLWQEGCKRVEDSTHRKAQSESDILLLMYGLEIMAVTKRQEKSCRWESLWDGVFSLAGTRMDKVRNETEGKLRLSGLKANLERQGWDSLNVCRRVIEHILEKVFLLFDSSIINRGSPQIRLVDVVKDMQRVAVTKEEAILQCGIILGY